MRTVSFSSAPVHDSLTEDFVCYSLNTEGDPSAGASVGHAPTDSAGHCSQGIGKQNVQCLFLTPEGEILHTASGFQGPEDLKGHLETAAMLFGAIQDDPDRSEWLVRDLHQKRLAAFEANDSARRPDSVAQFMTQFTRTAARGRRPGRTSVDNIFDFKTQDAAYNDNRYMVEHPLIPLEQLQRNPRELVGHGHTAFVSVGNGGASGGQIGR
jgi:hypothetical protein